MNRFVLVLTGIAMLPQTVNADDACFTLVVRNSTSMQLDGIGLYTGNGASGAAVIGENVAMGETAEGLFCTTAPEFYVVGFAGNTKFGKGPFDMDYVANRETELTDGDQF